MQDRNDEGQGVGHARRLRILQPPCLARGLGDVHPQPGILIGNRFHILVGLDIHDFTDDVRRIEGYSYEPDSHTLRTG